MKKITFAVIAFALVLVLSSCADILSAGDKFFTNSWGSAFSRTFDPSNISINANNANDWIARANGNSDLAYAVAQKINQDLAAGKVSEADKPAMIDAGVKLSIEASGIGVSLFTNAFSEIENLLDDEGDPAELIQNIFSNIQSDFVGNNGANVANNLAGIINGTNDNSTPNSPKLNEAYADSASVNDIVMAVTVLTLGVFAENNMTANSDSLESLDDITGIEHIDENGITINPATASPNVVALAAFYNTLADGRLDDDSFFSGFFDIFKP